MRRIEGYLRKAEEFEKNHGWLEAAELYGEVLRIGEEDSSKKAEIQEKLGLCFYKVALQTDKQDVLNSHVQKAAEAYEAASRAFSSLSDPSCKASAIRCKALALFCALDLLDKPKEIMKKLYTVLKFQKDALEAYKKSGDVAGTIAQCRDILQTIGDLLEYEEMRGKRVELVDLGLTYGEEAIQACLDLKNEGGLADVYLKLSELFGVGSGIFEDETRRMTCRNRQEEYLKNALELSERIGDSIIRAKAVSSHVHWRKLRSAGEAAPVYLRDMQDVLEECRKTRNRTVITTVINSITYGLLHELIGATDSDSADEIFAAIKKYTSESIRLNSVTLGKSTAIASLGDTYWYLGIAYRYYALLFEKDHKVRVKLLDKGIQIAKKIPSHTSPIGKIFFLSTYSYHLNTRASIEQDDAKRKKLLLEALKTSNQWMKNIENLFPYFYRLIADHLLVYSSIRAKLTPMEASDKQIKTLQEASEYSKKGIKYLQTGDLDKSLRINSANALLELGRIQFQLHQLTGNRKFLRESFAILEEAAQAYSAEGLYTRTAEAFWNLANMQDAARQFQQAAESFDMASKNYRRMAPETPQLEDFYMDYATYMQAWSDIEKAKHYHARGEYHQAKKHYEKAANLHGSSKSWKYLASNYLAWAQLEYGENLSRDEQTKEAIRQFQRAIELFQEAKSTLRVAADRAEKADEKDLAKRLIKASGIREEYCIGRIAVEKAKILDRQGDNAASSTEYGLAAKRFQKILNTIEHESSFTNATITKDRRELMPIIYLCKAWQIMTKAEAEASPELYLEASQLFDKAKEHSFNEKARLLALGHSRFCKALEAGKRFEDSRDPKLYMSATQHIESAANYYVKAGFKIASEYAIATQRLFDAYVYMANAKKEADPGKKAKYYIIAEKVLQISIGSYLKAKHPAKSAQVQRLLEKVREERELAALLSEVLRAPTITSSTVSFVTPTPTEETAVGLERFEHANIQADLILPEKEIPVGKDFNLELQIANVGKGAVLLDRVEGIFPPGFELVAKPSYCNSEDMDLNMRGKRLDPLKNEEIRLVLRSFHEGAFEIKPRIVYVDEEGHQLVSELEPVAIKFSKVILPRRINTGFNSLDNLLFGGIPENYSVILTSPSCDEKDFLIKSFLEAGAREGQITFYITTKAIGVENLAEKFRSNLYLFVCNPQAETIIKDLPNVYRLKGVENLTDISIALTSAFRGLDKPAKTPRRACVEIVSDVLLQHNAVQTRRWLNALLPEFKSKGFTTLAVIDPGMHSSQEVRAVLDLFEGEITIYEKENETGVKKFLKIKKMYNQKHFKNELPI